MGVMAALHHHNVCHTSIRYDPNEARTFDSASWAISGTGDANNQEHEAVLGHLLLSYHTRRDRLASARVGPRDDRLLKVEETICLAAAQALRVHARAYRFARA
jgi:hypothetical protein